MDEELRLAEAAALDGDGEAVAAELRARMRADQIDEWQVEFAHRMGFRPASIALDLEFEDPVELTDEVLGFAPDLIGQESELQHEAYQVAGVAILKHLENYLYRPILEHADQDLLDPDDVHGAVFVLPIEMLERFQIATDPASELYPWPFVMELDEELYEVPESLNETTFQPALAATATHLLASMVWFASGFDFGGESLLQPYLRTLRQLVLLMDLGPEGTAFPARSRFRAVEYAFQDTIREVLRFDDPWNPDPDDDFLPIQNLVEHWVDVADDPTGERWHDRSRLLSYLATIWRPALIEWVFKGPFPDQS